MNNASSPFRVRRSGRRFLEAVEDLRQNVPEDLRRTLPDIHGAVAGTAIVAAEVHTARKAGRLQEPAELVLMSALTHLLFSDESGFVRRPGLALLACQHLLRAEQLDRFAIDRIVESDGPEHLACAPADCECAALRPAL